MPVKVPSHSYVIIMSVTDDFDKGINRLVTNDMKNALERERARSSFRKSVSHDIRTPLTAIIGNLALLKEKTGCNTLIAAIENDAMWLRNLVNNILAVTKLEHIGTDHHELSVLQDVIYNVYQLTEKRTGGRPLIIDEPAAILTARIDEKMITQVLLNLIDKAVKFTPADSSNILSMKQEEAYAVLEVKDNGRGVDADIQERIFEAYYTSDATSDQSRKGLGLGLYLSQTILKAYQSSLYVSQNEPQGAVFGFRLPLEEVKL